MDRANKKMSAVQQESDRVMRNIFMGSPIGIALFDRCLHLLEANPALSKAIGYSIEELKKIDVLTDIFLPPDARHFRQQVSLLRTENLSAVRMQSRLRKKNGDCLTTELSLSLTQNSGADDWYVICHIEDVTASSHARSVLINSEKMHRLLARDLIGAQENERRNVVLELHDVIGGNLGAAKYLLEKLKLQLPPDADNNKLVVEKLSALISDTINEVQRLSTSLRPPGLDDMGILAALKWQVRKHNEIYADMPATLNCSIEENDIPAAIKIDLFRVAQEALNNGAKHSQATAIELFLQKINDKVLLTITDNGVGLHPEILGAESADRGLGLRNMQSRVELSGGTIAIDSTAGGTMIYARWNCAEPL